MGIDEEKKQESIPDKKSSLELMKERLAAQKKLEHAVMMKAMLKKSEKEAAFNKIKQAKGEEQKKKKRPVLDFIIQTMDGMAKGLFATLILGVILETIGKIFHAGTFFNVLLTKVAEILKNLTGIGIGLGVAWKMKIDELKLVSLASVGGLSAYLNLDIYHKLNLENIYKVGTGNPLTVYLVVIFTYLLMKLVLRKKTPVDIIVIPLFIITVGTVLSLFLWYPVDRLIYVIQWVVEKGTEQVPFLMGIIVSVVMGLALTSPISSAAIAAMVFNSESPALLLAGGAAVVGCSVQMIGFAVQSIRDNSIGKVISVGIGTSMLQFKNILKKPVIWLPTIITSAILGPVSTCLVKVKCGGAAAGMGTSGLVGQIGTIAAMERGWFAIYVSIFVMQIIAPAVLTLLFDLCFRKLGLIKKGDLTI